MGQDLDQILLLIGSVLGGGFALILLLAWLEPSRGMGSAPAAPALVPAPVPVPVPVADQVA